MDDPDILSRYPVSRHRLSVADFYRLADAGILGENDRVELLEGQLIATSPVGTRHALAVDALNDLLSPALTPPARLRVQNPVTLNGDTEPLPVSRWSGGHGAAIRGSTRDQTISFSSSRSPIPVSPSIRVPNAFFMLGRGFGNSGSST
jgi:hypothetical protein